MASSQCERKEEEVAVQFSIEEKANLDEIIKHAECVYVSEDIEIKSQAIIAENEPVPEVGFGGIHIHLGITVIAGALKNQTKGSLKVLDSKKWAGHIVKNFPNPLNNLGAIALSAMSHKGVKAAVAYTGKNHAGVECAWLLAFADTKPGGRRIYAECGPKSKFNCIDWARIEHKLANAGALARIHDKETGTSVYATLVGSGHKDVLAAAFCG